MPQPHWLSHSYFLTRSIPDASMLFLSKRPGMVVTNYPFFFLFTIISSVSHLLPCFLVSASLRYPLIPAAISNITCSFSPPKCLNESRSDSLSADLPLVICARNSDNKIELCWAYCSTPILRGMADTLHWGESPF